MKQVAQIPRTGEIVVVDVPEPRVKDGHVVVANAFSLVSAGTERMKIEMGRKSLLEKARSRPDLVKQVMDKARTEGVLATLRTVNERLDSLAPLGYSSAGTVVEVGGSVTDVALGDRVACAGAECAHHAEYILVPRLLCAKVPPDVPLESAAYTTVGAIALQGIRQSGVVLGERVLVIGLGLIGQLTLKLLRSAGCRAWGADVSESQVLRAGALGFSAVQVSDEGVVQHLWSETDGSGFDSVIVAAAAHDNSPLVLAGDVARDRARIVVVGAAPVEFPRSPFYEKEISVWMSRSYGPGRYDPSYEQHGRDYPIGHVRWTENRNMQAFLDALRSGSVDPSLLTTHRFEILRADKAYEIITSPDEETVGVLIEYPSAADVNCIADRRIVEPRIVDDAVSRREAVVRDGPASTGLAIVGVGNFVTKTLLPAIRASGELTPQVVVSERGLSAASVAKRYGIPSSESDARVAFTTPGIAAAVIGTRHDTHAELVERAMRSGLDVFVEKPLCIRKGDLSTIVRAQQETGRLCMVGFNRRFAPATGEVMRFFDDDHSPRVVNIRVDAGQIPANHWIQDPDVGGGRIVGEVCHFVDLAIYLSGCSCTQVRAVSIPSADAGVADEDVSAILTHVDGSVSSIVYTARGSMQLGKERIEVFGSASTAVIDDFRLLQTSRGPNKRKRRMRQDKGHDAEMAAFSLAVRGGAVVPQLSFEDAVHTTLVTFALVESVRTGRSIAVEEFRSELLGA